MKYEPGDEMDLGGTGPLDELDIIQSCRMARLSAFELREQLKFKDSLNSRLHACNIQLVLNKNQEMKTDNGVGLRCRKNSE